MTTSDRSHDLIEELIAADVLHGLDELDRRRLERELESHGPDCEECDRLIAEYSEVAARLAVSLDPAAPSAEAEERVMALVRELDDTGGEPERVGREGPPAGGASRRRRIAFVAVAAAFAVLGGLVGRALPRTGTRVDQRFLAFAAEPGTRIIAFPPKDGETLAVAVNPAAPGGWIVGSGLPGLADGKVYELWYLPEPNGNLLPAGTFEASGGRVVSPVSVGASFVALAVSIEPHGGSQTPTLPPDFITTKV